MGFERRIERGGRPPRTPTLRRPWFIRIERIGINEYDAAAGAFVKARRVLRPVRPRDNNSAKKSAPADVASKGALSHCPKRAESGTVCLYSSRSKAGSDPVRPVIDAKLTIGGSISCDR